MSLLLGGLPQGPGNQVGWIEGPTQSLVGHGRDAAGPGGGLRVIAKSNTNANAQAHAGPTSDLAPRGLPGSRDEVGGVYAGASSGKHNPVPGAGDEQGLRSS